MIIWCVFFSHHSHAAKLLTAVKKKSSFKAANMGENAGRTVRTVSKLMDINSMCYYKMTIW